MRVGKQLRELEIESDIKFTSGTNQSDNKDRAEEFDPLEMDRYTKLQQLSRGLAENLDELSTIQGTLSNFVYRTENSLQKQDRLNRELQDEIMQVRLVSFGGIGPQLRQVVRRTARELKKDVELEIIGAEVRLDKTVLDGVVPALEHMLRNSVDHGIETPRNRTKNKKSKIGNVVVECRQVAREIIINVRDDGVGLDLEKIRLRAIEDKLLADDQPLNPEDMLMYISQSGFSTASKLTQISGRGVGMDVVQTTLRRMSGSITYDLADDRPGSSFTIRLPISLAVSSAIFVESGGEQFAVAARTIERVVNIESEELIGYLKADKPTMVVDGMAYALIDLADYLGYDSKLPTLDAKVAVILVNAGVQNIAVIVEELLDTQEIVVKNLGDHLGRIPIYAGATIRADGQVVLLIDLVGISYYESFISMPELNVNVTHSIPNVMVVDDSLTVRKSAERDISALGINAILAKDGLDAQMQLRQEVPDMILLDIEMPLMDGFELLEWVKGQRGLKQIPVIMISSRATEKHINKATQLGCSAFLGKPYLLENLVEVFNQHLSLDAPIVLDK
jgi:chemosensory pili system protein ChpA (sensor histidine kinase/response regulator)